MPLPQQRTPAPRWSEFPSTPDGYYQGDPGAPAPAPSTSYGLGSEDDRLATPRPWGSQVPSRRATPGAGLGSVHGGTPYFGSGGTPSWLGMAYNHNLPVTPIEYMDTPRPGPTPPMPPTPYQYAASSIGAPEPEPELHQEADARMLMPPPPPGPPRARPGGRKLTQAEHEARDDQRRQEITRLPFDQQAAATARLNHTIGVRQLRAGQRPPRDNTQRAHDRDAEMEQRIYDAGGPGTAAGAALQEQLDTTRYRRQWGKG
jgi:hypothetical protein